MPPSRQQGAGDITTLRLYLLRAAYFMIFIFLTTQVLPQAIMRGTEHPHMSGVARALLGALGPLALLGVRYPIKMLPILLFELTWKAIWVLAIGLPLRMANKLDPGQAQTFIDCTFGVVLCLIVIPWPYVIETYVRAPGRSLEARASGRVTAVQLWLLRHCVDRHRLLNSRDAEG